MFHSVSTTPCLGRKLIFEGNSMMNWAINHTHINGRYVTNGIYNNVREASSVPIVKVDWGTSSQNQQQINAQVNNRIIPILKEKDIVFLWEGCNDFFTNDVTATEAYNNVVTYANALKPYGIKLVIATVVARNHASDPVDMMTRINDYNTLLRNNYQTFSSALCDLGADAMFDEESDSDNLTNYHTDKTHIVQAGQDRVITLASASIISIL